MELTGALSSIKNHTQEDAGVGGGRGGPRCRRREAKREEEEKEKGRSPLAGDYPPTTSKTTSMELGVPPTPLDQEPPPTTPAVVGKRPKRCPLEQQSSSMRHISGLCPTSPGHHWPSRHDHWTPLIANNKSQPRDLAIEARRRQKTTQKNPTREVQQKEAAVFLSSVRPA